jgi:hypothetical protein
MTRNEELKVSIMTLRMFARYAAEGLMSNCQFETHCQNFIAESGLQLGDAEAYIECAIEDAERYV